MSNTNVTFEYILYGSYPLTDAEREVIKNKYRGDIKQFMSENVTMTEHFHTGELLKVEFIER
jgi:hypothetical protein